MKTNPARLLFILILLVASGCASSAGSPALELTSVNAKTYPLPLNVAHRGARSLAPENTMAAARAAYALGADQWELDAAVSADGELVILHDDTLERTSNVEEVYPDRRPWAVHTFTFEELCALDFGSWFNEKDPFKQIAAGAVTPEMQRSYVGEPIPTLREALVYTRDNDWSVNVEIKDATGTPGDEDVVEKVAALIEELGMNEMVLVSSFNHDYLRRMKAANPAVRTAALVEARTANPAGLVKELGAIGYNPDLGSIHVSQIPALRAAGVDVNVWTINDLSEMRALVDHYATSVITDFPQRMNEVLAEKR